MKWRRFSGEEFAEYGNREIENLFTHFIPLTQTNLLRKALKNGQATRSV